jgi:hypothetical protein
MKAIWFPEQNTIMAKDQIEYKALPSFRGRLNLGNTEIVACYKLSDEELKTICETKVIWLRQLVGEGMMQPQLPQVESPFK